MPVHTPKTGESIEPHKANCGQECEPWGVLVNDLALSVEFKDVCALQPYHPTPKETSHWLQEPINVHRRTIYKIKIAHCVYDY